VISIALLCVYQLPPAGKHVVDLSQTVSGIESAGAFESKLIGGRLQAIVHESETSERGAENHQQGYESHRHA
jgi:hypothetical protein